jgi:peroxiredoxin
LSASSRTIAAQAAAHKEASSAKISPELGALLVAERRRIAAVAESSSVAAIGSAFPDGPVLNVNGHPTTISEQLAGKPAVVVFYRGVWCPYCNMALSTYQTDLLPALSERGVALIAISPQKPDNSLTMKQRHDLSFAVLSDQGNRIARAIGIVSPPPSEEARAALASLGADIAGSNADGTDALPLPASVVVNAHGIIRWIDVHADYTKRSEVDDILSAVSFTLNEKD